MYLLLFNLAGLAIVGWALMIFFPTWLVTRWITRITVFPVYLAALYVAGVGAATVRDGTGKRQGVWQC